MIIIDVNILIYAVNRDAPLHSRAKAWLESAISGTETLGISWTVLLAFLRLTTRPGLFRNPMPIDDAFDVLDSWLAQASVAVIEPGPRHASILRGILLSTGTGGNLTSDAHLAALALEQRAELCSSDHDFHRFPGLKWRNPLA
ncbi:MAG TPA: type II toxin-antitoxin system VapC family toxin [Bryobacteraceae bacterium]|nr:type II toxin-antitoxin system VapC family toxin [Bryobacteraceae bacterium]